MITLSRSTRVALLLALASAVLASGAALAQCPFPGHPCPQPRPGPSSQDNSTPGLTVVTTPEGHFPSQDPFVNPPGTNFLLTVESNMFDGTGAEMPNTLPSRSDNPWNLHVPLGPNGDPALVTPIDPTSPSQVILGALREMRDQAFTQANVDDALAQLVLDVLEGNPLPYVWSGMPLLHYNGPLKVKQVDPVTKNVDIHQVWYDSHIESDTSLLDPSTVALDEWTITYTIDVLHRGEDDFSPFVMYFDAPPPGAIPGKQFGPPHVAMDQTFFPMLDGNRYVFKLKMSPAKYYNLTYTWGWRVHPPRVQVTENANKVAPPGSTKTLVDWEVEVFGADPRASEEAKLAAIAKIGELSPAKQMWIAMYDILNVNNHDQNVLLGYIDRALTAYFDWFDRTELPTGAKDLEDPNADMTLLYVNNTIYGKIKGGGWDTWFDWKTRPQTFNVTLYNGDHFPHGYMNVDFGGSRGWENQFVPTVPLQGIGCKFSFGRVHWWINAGGPWGGIITPPVAADGTPGTHKVELHLNFEPSRRLRLYQFDPLHHDVAVFSIH